MDKNLFKLFSKFECHDQTVQFEEINVIGVISLQIRCIQPENLSESYINENVAHNSIISEFFVEAIACSELNPQFSTNIPFVSEIIQNISIMFRLTISFTFILSIHLLCINDCLACVSAIRMLN